MNQNIDGQKESTEADRLCTIEVQAGQRANQKKLINQPVQAKLFRNPIDDESLRRLSED